MIVRGATRVRAQEELAPHVSLLRILLDWKRAFEARFSGTPRIIQPAAQQEEVRAAMTLALSDGRAQTTRERWPAGARRGGAAALLPDSRPREGAQRPGSHRESAAAVCGERHSVLGAVHCREALGDEPQSPDTLVLLPRDGVHATVAQVHHLSAPVVLNHQVLTTSASQQASLSQDVGGYGSVQTIALAQPPGSNDTVFRQPAGLHIVGQVRGTGHASRGPAVLLRSAVHSSRWPRALPLCPHAPQAGTPHLVLAPSQPHLGAAGEQQQQQQQQLHPRETALHTPQPSLALQPQPSMQARHHELSASGLLLPSGLPPRPHHASLPSHSSSLYSPPDHAGAIQQAPAPAGDESQHASPDEWQQQGGPQDVDEMGGGAAGTAWGTLMSGGGAAAGGQVPLMSRRASSAGSAPPVTKLKKGTEPISQVGAGRSGGVERPPLLLQVWRDLATVKGLRVLRCRRRRRSWRSSRKWGGAPWRRSCLTSAGRSAGRRPARGAAPFCSCRTRSTTPCTRWPAARTSTSSSATCRAKFASPCTRCAGQLRRRACQRCRVSPH